MDGTISHKHYTMVKEDEHLDNLQIVMGKSANDGGAGLVLSAYVMPGLGEHRINSVACGQSHALFLSSEGTLFSSEGGAPFVTVDLGAPGISIAAAASASAAVTDAGALKVWGRIGSAGKGAELLNTVHPITVAGPEPLKQVTMGSGFAIAVSRTGTRCFFWGSHADYGLPVNSEKSAHLVRSLEPFALPGAEPDAQIVHLESNGAVSCVLTSNGTLYTWGGKKLAGLPQVVPLEGLPMGGLVGALDISQNSETIFAVLSTEQVYCKARLKKSAEWHKWEQPHEGISALKTGEDSLMYMHRASGKLTRHVFRSLDTALVNTIRVSDFAFSNSGQNTVLCLAVYNTQARIFGSLFPDPVVKYCTAKGFVEWIVRTDCKYPSDLTAFALAFPTLLKMLVNEKTVRKGTPQQRREQFVLGGNPAAGSNSDGSGCSGVIAVGTLSSAASSSSSSSAGAPMPGLHEFVKILKKIYQGVDAKDGSQTCPGVVQLLSSWIDSKPHVREVRHVLGLTKSFLSDSEQAELWKRENLRAISSAGTHAGTRRLSDAAISRPGASLSQLELEDIASLPARSIALAMTLLRWTQFKALTGSDIVRFCMLAPDPAAFETYPGVAEFVDFGNTLGRWAKEFVLRGGTKSVRGTRIQWLYQLILELELLRNFDLAFHLSGALAWELMPDLAKQSKVDLDSMLAHVKRFGDKKYWTGIYQKALADQESMIPLLVYHSNSISGGFGGADSIVTKKWDGKEMSYLNVQKFRLVGDQQRQLEQVATWTQQYDHQQVLKGTSKDSDLFLYFQRVTAPSDAQLTVMRSQIIQVSRHRESGKVTSIENFASDLASSVSAQERRVVKWSSFVAALESDDEVVRMREAPFLVCARDAVLDGGLLPGVIRTLVQTISDIEWASHEYWLLRRILVRITAKRSAEDIIMAAATLYSRSVEAMPKAAEEFCNSFVDYLARDGKSSTVMKTVRMMEQTAIKMAPEIDAHMADFEKKITELKEKGGALSRAQKLLAMGASSLSSTTAKENSDLKAVQGQAKATDESVKLTKAQLEHFGAQRALVLQCQSAARDFGVLLDLWRAPEFQGSGTRLASFKNAVYFRVTHLGSKWGSGENQSFIHQEVVGMREAEFQEKMVALYGTVFGPDSVHFLDINKEPSSFALKAGMAYLQVAPVRLADDGGEGRPVFILEQLYQRENNSEPWRKRIEYSVESKPTKKRFQVVQAAMSLLSPIESTIDDIRSRASMIRQETEKRVPDKNTAIVLQQAMAPQSNAGLMKACAYLVDTNRKHEAEVLLLSKTMWDYLLSVRDALAFFSTSAEEADLRIHHKLCKTFREVLSTVLPSLGPPHEENFGFATLYQFVSLILPQGFQQPLVDSPMARRRASGTGTDIIASRNKPAPLEKLAAENRRTKASAAGATGEDSSSSPHKSRRSSSKSGRASDFASPASPVAAPAADADGGGGGTLSPSLRMSGAVAKEALDELPTSPFFK